VVFLTPGVHFGTLEGSKLRGRHVHSTYGHHSYQLWRYTRCSQIPAEVEGLKVQKKYSRPSLWQGWWDVIPKHLLPYYYSFLAIVCILAVVAVGMCADRRHKK